MAKVKTWVWVVIGIVAAGFVCLIALAAAGLWFARTHIQVQQTTSSSIAKEFDDVHARFASQKPLIEVDDRGHFVRANTDRPAGSPKPESLHILAFSAKDDKVVRMSIPFWLLRLKGPGNRITLGGRADFNGSDFDLRRMNITEEDLERYGPTLIVDHSGANGDRVLVWSQ